MCDYYSFIMLSFLYDYRTFMYWKIRKKDLDQLGPGIQKCEITEAMYEIIFNERI